MTTGVEGLAATGVPAGTAQDLAGAVDGITATAGGTQATSAIVANAFTRVGTVATSADGVGLPYSRAGSQYMVSNGNALRFVTVFAQGSDTIGGIAGATGFPLPPGRTAIFTAPAAGKWLVNLGA